MAAIVGTFIFALGLIVGPIAANVLGYPLGGLTTMIMILVGVALALLAGAMMVISRLYLKTEASMAFVRTGMGGEKVIKSGGAVVVPAIHQVTKVPLKTFSLPVERFNSDALITDGGIRADIRAEFFVRVQPDDASILNAARSFGGHMTDDKYVAKLVEDKLVSALRTVAATKSLILLNSDRDSFVKQVHDNVSTDLKQNGLTLETVTISKLDQTDPKALKDDNIFDSAGKRTIAEITQAQHTLRKTLEQKGEQDRMKVDVATQQQLLQMEKEREEFKARQASEIAVIRAEQTREATEKEIEAKTKIELANTRKTQQTEIAMREQQKAIEVAERSKQEAIIAANQKLEVAERSKQEAIANAEAQRTAAEALLASAEAERERKRQEVTTVQVEAEAERDRRKRVIAAEALAQEGYLKQEKAADAEAYAMKAKADGQRAAADAEAEAIRKRAEAEAAAATARATGLEAEAMVPVNVKRAEVEVEDRRVGVLTKELEARGAHGAAAQEFELAKLRITEQAKVQIAAASAMVTLTGKIEANVFGTPEDVAKMTGAYAKGMGLSKLFDGFMDGVDGGASTVLTQAGSKLSALLDSATTRLAATESEVLPPTPTTIAKTHGKAADSGNGAA